LNVIGAPAKLISASIASLMCCGMRKFDDEEWNYRPEHPRRERPKTTTAKIQLTIERPKRSLYWRTMNAYADTLIFRVKILAGIVLCGFSFAAFFAQFTILRVALS